MTQTLDPDSHPDLDTRRVVKAFAGLTAVDEVSFTVPAGSFFSILGPSGCGKTTLMRMIAGFEHPDAGEILIRGLSMAGVAPNRRPVNMVFQHLALFPMMSVARNVGYGLRRRALPRQDIDRRVDEILERVGLAGTGPRKIDQLSGGQKQRVAIARCLILDPTLLLLDEPLGALDLKLREQMKVELKQLQSDLGTTFVYITHDQSEALVMSDQVAVMNRGRFEQVGTPQDLYYDPRTAFVAGFVGQANRWQGTVESIDGDQIRAAGPRGEETVATAIGQLGLGAQVETFVRPEAIVLARTPGELASFDNHLTGVVESVLFDGGNSSVLVRDGRTEREITVALPPAGELADLAPGETVHLGWRADQARCFAATPERAQGTERA